MSTTSDLVVRVLSPSRLHFGFLAFGGASPRQFGGVGVMIDRPGTEILMDLSNGAEEPSRAEQDATLRAGAFVRSFCTSLERDQLGLDKRCRVRVVRAAPLHVGLGSGTQLGMAVAKACAIWAGQSDMPPQELAQRVGRGARSSIGVHGFNCGGFIVEGGKADESPIAPLVARLNFPPEWHFILVIPSRLRGLHGEGEREAFSNLKPMTPAVTAELCRITLLGLLPAVAERHFATFSEALFDFGRRVGECFSDHQGGTYASPLAGQVIEFLARHSVRGVAQSSWGPTVAAVVESRFRAEWLAARLADTLPADAVQIVCAAPNNLGAKVEILPSEGHGPSMNSARRPSVN